ncbi:MAG: hypothetical protein JHC69_05515 [Akkermansiaceae bacterium]|nr:hypothetical protein [Akkermansiaceae bacterium]
MDDGDGRSWLPEVHPERGGEACGAGGRSVISGIREGRRGMCRGASHGLFSSIVIHDVNLNLGYAKMFSFSSWRGNLPLRRAGWVEAWKLLCGGLL